MKSDGIDGITPVVTLAAFDQDALKRMFGAECLERWADGMSVAHFVHMIDDEFLHLVLSSP